ncbi:MAG TPA: hypothetical protein VNG33_03165 [Polyangiaceae bacterium]|nr:hypothetical protein [Polyangiaceae bacterium]
MQALQSQRAAQLLLELWHAFPDGEGVMKLFAERAVVELPVPLVRGTSKRLHGRSSIDQARTLLNTLNPGFRFRGDLRLMASGSSQVIAEYRRHPSESRHVGARRLFVWLLEEGGRVVSLRVTLERRYWTVRK